MKQIHFVRHGKSSWSDPGLADHDRPLGPRGKRDAPRMAARLLATGLRVDGILSSTAKRARKTGRVFADVFGIDRERFLTDEDLYLATPREIERVIRGLPPEWDSVLLFGHNPGYTDLANRILHQDTLENVPTAGIVGTHCDVSQWGDWRIATTRRTRFLYPKQLD